VRLSERTDVVLLPFRVQGMQVLDPFGEPAATLLEKLPLVAMVAAGEDIRLREKEEATGPPPEADAEGDQVAEAGAEGADGEARDEPDTGEDA